MMALVDNEVYVNGVRTESPANLDETFETMRSRGGMAWIGLYRPNEAEVRAVAEEFSLHPLAVQDALTWHQRSKLERYGDTLFVVLRPARYLDAVEKVEFGELHLFVGPDFIATIRHAESPNLAQVRHRLESTPELLSMGPEAVLYAIIDEVVDEYGPVIAGLENDIDEIENQLFADEDGVSRRIYELSREVIDFQRASQPLVGMLEALLRGSEKYQVDSELQRYLRGVLDHALRIVERSASFRTILENALTVDVTLLAQRQNDEMRRMTELNLAQNEEIKKISSWAAIIFAPTLVGTVYGMNFEYMPELGWELGYPFSLVLMVGIATGLYGVFRWKRWL